MLGWLGLQDGGRTDPGADTRRVQLQLVVAAVLVVSLSVALLLYLTRDNLEREKRGLIDRDLSQAAIWLDRIIASETAILGVALQAVEARSEFQMAYLQRDRGTLEDASAALYQVLNERHRVTHFYFHNTDGTVFLRAHEPERFGDVIARDTYDEAVRTQATSMGIELGANGLTLRYVSPWLGAEGLIGYLELGMEIGHTLRELEDSLGVQAVIALDASTLNRDAISETGIADSTNYTFDADRLLVSYGSLEVGDNVREMVTDSLAVTEGESIDFERNGEGRYLSAARVKLAGVHGPVGNVVFIKDVTAISEAYARTRGRYLVMILSLGVVSALAFSVAIARARSRIDRMAESMVDRLRRARASAKIGAWELWEDTGVIDATDEAVAVIDWQGESGRIEYEALLSHLSSPDSERLVEQMASALAEGTELNEVVTYTTEAGRSLSLRMRGSRQSSSEGVRIEGTVQDISDLKLAEARAVASEERQRAIIESTTDGIILINTSGEIIEANQATERIFGYSKAELIGHSVSLLMTGEDADENDRYLQQFLKTGIDKLMNTTHELEGRKRSGAVFPMRLGLREVTVGGQRYFVGSMNDLTEYNRLELQLRHSQKMEAIGQLSGGIAHDFNNILGIVVAQLDMMERTQPDEAHLKRIHSAQRAVIRGADLSRKLLSFSRSSAGATTSTNLSVVLESMRELVDKSLTSNIDVQWELAPDLWPCDIDPGALEDAIINLSINARDAMSEGGHLRIATRNITLSRYEAQGHSRLRPGDWVEVAISDDGAGIPEAVLDKIYDPFFTTKQAQKGTGLGLSMVYGFVDRSGGAITVYSKPGLGTTFRIYFPRVDAEMVADSPETEEALPGLPRGNESILVVDDEPDLAHAAEAILDRLGYRVTVCHSGEQALELLTTLGPFDLVFSDVVMPGEVNGLMLARHLRTHHPQTGVILSSGFAGRIKQDAGDEEWLDRLLTKPYRDFELATAVRERLDERQSGAQGPA